MHPLILVATADVEGESAENVGVEIYSGFNLIKYSTNYRNVPKVEVLKYLPGRELVRVGVSELHLSLQRAAAGDKWRVASLVLMTIAQARLHNERARY